MARAIKKLRVLGGGFAVIPLGGRRLVQSVPGELNMDHTAVLQRAEVRISSGRVQEACLRGGSPLYVCNAMYPGSYTCIM